MADDRSAAELFASLCAEFAGTPGVTVPGSGRPGFGSSALKINNSIFADARRGPRGGETAADAGD